MSSFQKIFSNTAIPVAGKFVSLLMSIVLIKLLSTSLGVDGFGYYITIFEFLALFITISEFGIYATSIKEMADCEPDRVPYILGNTIGLRLVMSVIAMLAASVVVAVIPDYQGTPVVIGIWVATIMVLINSATESLKAVLQVHYKIQYGTIAAIISKVARLVWVLAVVALITPGAAEHLGIDSEQLGGALNFAQSTLAIYLVVLGFTFGAIVEFIITLYYTRKYQVPSIRFDFEYWGPFLRKTAPYAAAIFLSAAYFRADTIILSLLEGPESVGIYAVAMRMIENGSFIAVVFVNALLPGLVVELRKGNSESIKGLLNKSWLFLLSVALPLALLATIFAVPLTLFLSNSDYLSGSLLPYGSDVAIQISVWAMLFSFPNRLFVFAALAMGKQSKILIINAVGVLFNIGTNLYFIPRYGLIAAAITTVVSEVLVFGMSFYVIRKELGFHPPVTKSLGIIGAAVAMFGTAWLAFVYAWDPRSILAMILISLASCVGYYWLLKNTALKTYLYATPSMGWWK